MEISPLDIALRSLPGNTAFRLANEARPPAQYLLSTILPERPDFNYDVNLATMTVRTTMAGLVGMDSPYPPTGVIDGTTWAEQTAKIANLVRLPEATIRKMQAMVAHLRLTNQPTLPYLQDTVLRFTDKLIVQAHLDAFEWLRGQALTTGKLDWTFNGKRLLVDYGVPAANLFAQRTGTDAYGGSTSKFWADVRLLQARLKYAVEAYIVHPDTLNVIIGNDVNKIEIVGGDGRTSYQIRRLVGANERQSTDARDFITLNVYGLEAEVLDPATGGTKELPFFPPGFLTAIGTNNSTTFDVGLGATGEGSTPSIPRVIGYTHIAPTTEGDGQPGRWADVRRPDTEPWALEGRGVTNGLPVIEEPKKLAVAKTQL